MSDMVVAIDRALVAAKIPHAIGGAIAYAYYAEPRVTIDVDVNVFIPTDRWSEVKVALETLGIDVAADESALARDGQVRLWWGRIAVDLFFSYDPFHDEMKGAIRQVPFGDVRIPILAPEHLAICKALFDRPKDWLDLEGMLIVSESLDLDEIRSWLSRMVGPGDERLEKLDALVTRLEL
ncbi:MAG: hypothetical protein JSS97_13460 [Actinobacteria bacterium]|nr:hypothetical protein [Actinomycetota bacterium]